MTISQSTSGRHARPATDPMPQIPVPHPGARPAATGYAQYPAAADHPASGMPRPRPQADATPTGARQAPAPAPRTVDHTAFSGVGIDGPTFRGGGIAGPAVADRGTGLDGAVAPQQTWPSRSERVAQAPVPPMPTPQAPVPPVFAQAPVQPMSASQGPARFGTTATGVAATPRRRRRWPFVVAGIVLLLIVIIATANRGNPTPAPTAATPVPAVPAVSVPTVSVPTASVPTASVPTAALPTVEAPAAPVASGPATEVGDGTYEVGVDMAAGKYKTTGPGSDSVMKMCYQERAKNDSGELDSIISNDLVQGPSVMTAKAGEVVKLSGGCQWTKQ